LAARTGAFSYLLAPGLRKVWFEGFQKRPTEYTAFMNILESSRAYEDDLRVAGLPLVVSKAEGTPVQYVDPIQGGTKRYTHLSFGLGFRVTFEMYQDDLYRIMNRMSLALSRSVHQSIEVLAHAPLVHAFDSSPATAYQGFDGLALASTAHTMLGAAANQGNRPSTDIAFSLTAIRDSCIRFEKLYDEQGIPLLLKPALMIIPPDTKWAAREILGSGFKPYTANNEINALVEEDLSYMVDHFLSSTTTWYNLSKGGLQDGVGHDLNFFWRQKPIFDSGDDFDTGDAKFKVFFRASTGFGYWYGVDASSP
jgi:hypothetical protein